MVKLRFPIHLLFLVAFSGVPLGAAGQGTKPENPVFHVNVDLVQLNVAVTDNKGNYVTGLGPKDFAIFEDGIAEKIATFSEENELVRNDIASAEKQPQPGDPSNHSGELRDAAPPGFLEKASPDRASALVAGANVFILFDTSNYMYRGFVFAQDAIAEFVRSLGHPDRVAFYSYSRDFSRHAVLTADRSQVLHGVRATVAGADAALYNSLLMTLKDAALFSGRKVVVVFSNGPDNASMVSPEDVRELAQTEGIPVYMISTREAKLDPVSTAVFERLSASSGGIAYFAKTWKDQQKAFASIRDDLAHLYSVSYYPQPNANPGWRSITVKLVGENAKNHRIRTRSGYRPKAAPVPQARDAGTAQ